MTTATQLQYRLPGSLQTTISDSIESADAPQNLAWTLESEIISEWAFLFSSICNFTRYCLNISMMVIVGPKKCQLRRFLFKRHKEWLSLKQKFDADNAGCSRCDFQLTVTQPQKSWLFGSDLSIKSQPNSLVGWPVFSQEVLQTVNSQNIDSVLTYPRGQEKQEKINLPFFKYLSIYQMDFRFWLSLDFLCPGKLYIHKELNCYKNSFLPIWYSFIVNLHTGKKYLKTVMVQKSKDCV